MAALIWSNCWRRVYDEEARRLGYRCKWASGHLAIYSSEGIFLAYVKPKTKEFAMLDLIDEAFQIVKKEDDKREEKLAEQDSRRAAGEPRAITKKNSARNFFGISALIAAALNAK